MKVTSNTQVPSEAKSLILTSLNVDIHLPVATSAANSLPYLLHKHIQGR